MELKKRNIQGHWCPTLEAAGLICCWEEAGKLPGSLQFTSHLLHLHQEEIWSTLSSPVFVLLVSWRKKKMTDGILMQLFLRVVLLFFSLQDALWFKDFFLLLFLCFLSLKSGEVWNRIFSIIKRVGTDTSFWAAAVRKAGKRSSSLNTFYQIWREISDSIYPNLHLNPLQR